MVLKKVGEGANGVLYQIYDESKKNLRIVKLYKDPIDSQNRLQYKEETEKLLNNQHEGIVKIYNYGFIEIAEKDYFYVIMEHIEGKSLEKIQSTTFQDQKSFLFFLFSLLFFLFSRTYFQGF